MPWNKGKEFYYPVNDKKNMEILRKYEELAENKENVILGGRLGRYKYYYMWKTIGESLKLVEKSLKLKFKNISELLKHVKSYLSI